MARPTNPLHPSALDEADDDGPTWSQPDAAIAPPTLPPWPPEHLAGNPAVAHIIGPAPGWLCPDFDILAAAVPEEHRETVKALRRRVGLLRGLLVSACDRVVALDTPASPPVCPVCGAPEVDAMTPRTVYACGSSTYDERPGTFRGSCGEVADVD